MNRKEKISDLIKATIKEKRPNYGGRIKVMIGMDETTIYEGKPDKKCFIFESIFNPLLPVAIIWAVFDMGFQFTKKNQPAVISINSISNYSEVYQIVKKLQKDIYSDIIYPNNLRPEENHGYKTKYRGRI